MNTVEVIVTDEKGVVAVPNGEQIEVHANPSANRGAIIQQNYVLNDTAALKKKLRNETKTKEPFNTGTDGKDGSNVVLLMKTSFFEHVKSAFIQDLINKEGISGIENAVATKAQTAHSGDAFVEYALEIGFVVDATKYMVKFTAYPTTCKIMVQPMGGKPKILEGLGKRSVARYFVDTFLLPWCEEAQANKKYDEEGLLEAIRNEIVRLDLLKVDTKRASGSRGRLASVVSSSEAKCAARTCKFTGLNMNNKVAVGLCSKCGLFEHFECSKTKQDDRDLILKGEQKYFCTTCFSRNPAMIAFEGNKTDKTDNISKLAESEISNNAITLEEETTVKYKCGRCEFESTGKDLLNKHTKEVHQINCETCKESFWNKEDLDKHIKSNHARPCILCKLVFKTISELKEHTKIAHGPECTICSLKFEKSEELEMHNTEIHNKQQNNKHMCTKCNSRFDTFDDLKKHMENNHAAKCNFCDIDGLSEEDLDSHKQTEHGAHCPFCPVACKNIEELSVHLKQLHAPAHECTICKMNFQTKTEYDEHTFKEHTYTCDLCGNTLKTSTELKMHVERCKVFPCDKCNDIFYDEENLKVHQDHKHMIQCSLCPELLTTESKLQDHIEQMHRAFKCHICEKVFDTKVELDNHIKKDHTDAEIEVVSFVCESCPYEDSNADTMKEHVIEEHGTKDQNGEYTCYDCNLRCDKKENLVKHYRQKHKKNRPADDNKTPDDINLKEEHRLLKNNFERLNALFQETLEELDSVKADFKIKLDEVTEKYREAKIENEELKEKVDILFKLGRGYISKAESLDGKNGNQDSGEEAEGNKETVIDITEEQDKVDDSESFQSLSSWQANKYRGFRRVSPAAPSRPQTPARWPSPPVPQTQPLTPTTDARTPGTTDTAKAAHHPAETISERLKRIEKNNPVNDVRRKPMQYCHFYTNFGTCNYEEKTGKKCKFEHVTAPMCQRGMSCNRPKCMYTHPNTGGRTEHFLGQRSQNHSPPSPWQQVMMMNPWAMMQMNPYQNNTMNMNPFQNHMIAPFQHQRLGRRDLN